MNCAAPPLVKRILILFFLVFPLFTLPVLAQEIDDSDLRAGSDPFPTLQISRPSEITVIPKFPKANTDVYIEIKNYSIDLNNSNITWRVNGVVKSQGKGVTTFSTKTGKNGELITVTASIRDERGISLTETIRLRPAEIDLVWESDGYTPPFYRGKAAYTEGANQWQVFRHVMLPLAAARMPNRRQHDLAADALARVGEIEVSGNEWAKACNLRDQYWLYVVFECASANF